MGTKVPYTVALLIVGLALGFLYAEEDLGIYAGPSIRQWVYISPHLLLFSFLPPLVFESAFNLEWHMFTKLFSQTRGECYECFTERTSRRSPTFKLHTKLKAGPRIFACPDVSWYCGRSAFEH
eukprot:6384898-Pyramimonas_sp.AAC.1